MNKKLTKGNPYESIVCGVCSGLSEYFGVDVIILRFIWTITILFYGVGLIPYIILTLIMSDKDF